MIGFQSIEAGAQSWAEGTDYSVDDEVTVDVSSYITRSGDVGWTDGDDISSNIASTLEGLTPGTIFVFDGFFQNTARQIDLPNSVTLAGGVVGAGLNTSNTASNSAPIFRSGTTNGTGDAITVRDLKFTHSDAPTLIPTIPGDVQQGTYYTSVRLFSVSGGAGAHFVNSVFEDNINIFISIGTHDDLVVDSCTFQGAYWQMAIGGDCRDMLYKNCLSRDSLGDGIKTTIGANMTQIVRDPIVENCVFIENWRDGVDTTGGFLDGIIRYSYFVRLEVTGVDLKHGYDPDRSGPYPPDYTTFDFALGENPNNRVLFDQNEFINCSDGGIVLTTLDQYYDDNPAEPALVENGAGLSDADIWAIKGITCTNNIHESTGSGAANPFVRNKDSGSVSIDGLQSLGNTQNFTFRDDYPLDGKPEPAENTAINVTTGPARTQQPSSYYYALAGADPSSVKFAAGNTVMTYRCLQAHTSVAGQEPPTDGRINVLWELV